MNRRSFVKTTVATVGSLSLGLVGCAGDGDGDAMPAEETPSAETTDRTLDRIGVQLYTVRSLLGEDFGGVLEQIAAIGYDEVEFAGYYDHAPDEVRAILDRTGLAAPAAHASLDAFRNDLDAVLDAAQAIGHAYLILAWLPEEERQTLDQYREHAALANEVGARCQEVGIQFAYHNHDFEFFPIDGTVPYDVFLAETDPDLVKMEIDLFWITKAGADPTVYFADHPGRFALCHVKDMSAAGEMVAVGEGTIDFAAIFAQQDEAGLRHFFVEHDNPDDPMASIRTSYETLYQLRY